MAGVVSVKWLAVFRRPGVRASLFEDIILDGVETGVLISRKQFFGTTELRQAFSELNCSS